MSLTQLLADMTPEGMLLPQVVHFIPTAEFLDAVKQQNSHCVVDVGSGVGLLSRLLADQGQTVIAIDTNERDHYDFPPLPLNAFTFTYPRESLPILARPCHGPWVPLAIERALTCVPKVWYVGLRKNFLADLGGLSQAVYSRKVLPFKAGKDGERVVEIALLSAPRS